MTMVEYEATLYALTQTSDELRVAVSSENPSFVQDVLNRRQQVIDRVADYSATWKQLPAQEQAILFKSMERAFLAGMEATRDLQAARIGFAQECARLQQVASAIPDNRESSMQVDLVG
jgi:hypothetical protein